MTVAEELRDIWRTVLTGVEITSTVSEWATKYREISSNASARPGPWDCSLTPYLTGIMDACSVDDPCHKVVMLGSAQIGKTEAMLNVIGYRIQQWPTPIMVVVPRDQDVSEYAESRIDPLVQQCPALRVLIKRTEYSKDGSDSAATKRFPGGKLSIRGSRAGATYRSDPFGMVILDDLDAFGNNPEGDHVELAERRTNTFSTNARKVFLISTPTEQGSSRIVREFEQSSKKRYWVPCPECGAFQVLWRKFFRWIDDNPETAHFVCQHCAAAIYERHKADMLANGYWQAERPERSPVVEGFHIWAAYSNFQTWPNLAESFIQAVATLRRDHDDDKLRAVLNTDWAEEYVPEGQMKLKEREMAIYARREPVFAVESLELIAQTVGMDVQINRLELTRWGWGKGQEAWLLEHKVIKGIPEHEEPWDEAVEYLIEHKVGAVCVDGNAFTDTVLDKMTARAQTLYENGCAAWAVKGVAGRGPLWPGATLPGNPKDRRFRLVSIRVDAGKDWLFGSLERVLEAGPSYIHFDLNATKNVL